MVEVVVSWLKDLKYNPQNNQKWIIKFDLKLVKSLNINQSLFEF